MIVQKLVVPVVPYRTLKTCIRLREAMCDGELLRASGLVLRIERIHCYRSPPPVRQVWNGCCYVPCEIQEPPCDSPVIEYPAFDTDSDGRVCFYFDRLLYTQPEGRYKAVIRRGGRVLFTFGLALDTPPLLAEQVANVESQDCAEQQSCRCQ